MRVERRFEKVIANIKSCVCMRGREKRWVLTKEVLVKLSFYRWCWCGCVSGIGELTSDRVGVVEVGVDDDITRELVGDGAHEAGGEVHTCCTDEDEDCIS